MKSIDQLALAAFVIALILITLVSVGGVYAQSDNFDGMTGITAPAQHAVAITASDSVNLSTVCRGIYVGGAGDVVVVMKGGEVVTFAGVPAGTTLPLRATRVNSTSTTATSMVCVW